MYLAPPRLQTLGEEPLGQGKRLHSRWVMSGWRGAGTAVSRHPAATPGLRPGAQEEREGDKHSWGTGVTLAFPSLPVCFPCGLMCVGFIRSHVPPQPPPLPPLQLAPSWNPAEFVQVQRSRGCESRGHVRKKWGCHQCMAISAPAFRLLPPSQSPLTCPAPSIGQQREQRSGKPHCCFIVCNGVSYFPGLLPPLCLNIPTH